MRRVRAVAPLFAALALACGSDPVTTPAAGGSGGSGGSSGKGGSGGSGMPAPQCERPSFADESVPQVTVGKVTATVVDLDEAPVAATPIMVCGVDLCSDLGETDRNGEAAVRFTSPVRKPAFKYGDGLLYGELAILLPETEDDIDLGTVHLPALPAVGAPIEPEVPAESGGATLTLPEGGVLTLDAFAPYDTPENRAFRAAELPPELFPDGLDHGAELEQVFTLAPLGAELCPFATLSLPNSAGWDPGTEVEFLVQGFGVGLVEGDQPFAPYGDWEPVATGVVSDDGERLEMTDGGLPLISNVGVRRL